MSAATTAPPTRVAEIHANLAAVHTRLAAASASGPPTSSTSPLPTLVAVSKYKPASDILAAYAAGHRDFGENYVQELVAKAPQLPQDIRWHFIGHVQSNKARLLAALPNLHTLHTLASPMLASALDRARATPAGTVALPPLRVLLQLNTSDEPSKAGLPAHDMGTLLILARHIVNQCPHLRLTGLMTIGAVARSHAAAAGAENKDFVVLREAGRWLEEALAQEFPRSEGESAEQEEGGGGARWGENGALVLSMGMSSDYEAAIRAGSGIVRVGSAIFGERPAKGAGASAGVGKGDVGDDARTV